VLQSLHLTLHPGARIGLLGRNGAGKSTLTRLLAGAAEPLSGRRTEGYGLKVGYFAQHQLEQLHPADSPLRHLVLQEPQTRESELRSYLGHFDFRGEKADAPVAPLSGGEKSRLALALMVRRRPNLLLLDEPTNHLDLEMRHALTRALAAYEGSLVLVSHDRTLLRTVCDRFLLVADGTAAEFDGDIDDYLQWLAGRRDDEATTNGPITAQPEEREARRLERIRQSEQRRERLARRRPLAKEAAALEARITRLESEKAALDSRLADPDSYSTAGGPDVAELSRRHGGVSSELSAAEERWLAVQSEIERLDAN
jgi:ATP-binding cassette subfamily F protein 3